VRQKARQRVQLPLGGLGAKVCAAGARFHA
jgi:hypothetical protein